MVEISTGSRLHFGMFSVPGRDPAAGWPDTDGNPVVPMRHFGGVGLMIQRPALRLAIEEAKAWSADGPQAERALQFAQQFCAGLGLSQRFRLQVHEAPASHAGLGSGTQLGMAVGRGIAALAGLALEPYDITRRVGRGRRSALGVHGFQRGGFLVEGGKLQADRPAPLLARLDFPADWRVVLAIPRGIDGVHGPEELTAFRELPATSAAQTEALCRLALLGLMPALIELDLRHFGEALYDFNRRVGAMFAGCQGGTYAHPRVAELVQRVRQLGVAGVGQSSWGPAVFAIADADQAAWLRTQLAGADAEVVLTPAANHGALLA